jgi:hypothetical protein
MMHHNMNRALGRAFVGVVCGVITACAGGDTPARNSTLESFLSDEFGTGVVGAVGGTGGDGGSGNSGSGNNGGRGGTASGSGGSDSGSGGSDAENGGTGGDEPSNGGSGGVEECDGFQILSENCGTSNCHGMGAVFTPFVASESDISEWVDAPAATGCASTGDSVFDTANPAASLVITKLGTSPPCGGRMPPPAPGSITPAQIACIEEFIEGL